MNTKAVIGRKIVSVRQVRFWNEHMGSTDYEVHSITLDNGSRIILSTTETVDQSAVVAFVVNQEGKTL